MPRSRRQLLLVMVLTLPLQVLAQSQGSAPEDSGRSLWAGVGLGGGSVNSLAPAPSSGRNVLAASFEVGYRLNRQFGLGLEFGAVAPLSGCADWQCGASAADFAPSFKRIFAIGEFRPRDSGWRLRAGLGMSRFCYQRHWSENAWSMFDTVMLLIDDDYLYYSDGGSGAWRCDAARRALGGSISVGHDWNVGAEDGISYGVRLSAEAANFSENPAIGMPAFRHRAVMLTLHLNVN
jgi:hypothetical protein